MSEQGSAVVSRQKKIVRTSLLGIGANIALAGFKAAVGLLAHSIAIVTDAVNNLTDALSSVITVFSARYSAKPADRKHPFGHGRIEYFAAELIAMLVIYAGITALVESVKKIIERESAVYDTPGLIIIAVAVLVKVLLGWYFKKVGKETNSEALSNSGQDATLDAVISVSTLVAALLNHWLHWEIEAWLGAAISLFIVYSGAKMLMETVSELLGARADSELSKSIRETINGVDGVLGSYDLFLTDYGPDRMMGSVHIEIPDTLSAREIDALCRKVQETCYLKHSVALTAVGIYAHNTSDDEAARIRDDIRRRVMSHEGVLQLHGFYLDEAAKTIRFDVILDFALPDRHASYDAIVAEIREAYPDWHVSVVLDTDISD